MCGKQYRIPNGLWPLTLLCILIACTYQQPPLQPEPKGPPPFIETEPETPIVAPDTPTLDTPVATPSETRLYLHKVRWPEETLSHIARWYTGNLKNWEAIIKVNPGVDPKKIDVGDTISIPEDLMTSRQPMPRSFLEASVQKKAVSFSSPRKSSTPLESPKLFGPIESEPSLVKTDSAELFGPLETESSAIESDETKLFGPIE